MNVNYVYGFSSKAPQNWMHPHLFLAVVMLAMPLTVYLPTHWLLSKAFGRAAAPAPEEPVAGALTA